METTLKELDRHWSSDPRWSQLAAPERQRLVEAELQSMHLAQQAAEETAARAYRKCLLETWRMLNIEALQRKASCNMAIHGLYTVCMFVRDMAYKTVN